MANGQSYNQYTRCISPQNYSGLYLGGSFTGAAILSIILFVLSPGAGTLSAILFGIGYCRWWLYQRLVCLGGNRCFIGLVLRVDTQHDQSGFFGKFDTDYTLSILPAPSRLLGDQNWYNEMNQPANDVQGELMRDQSLPSGSPANPDFAQMRQRLSIVAPNGFSGETVTGYDLVDHDGYHELSPAGAQALNFLTPPDWQPNYFYTPGDQIRDSNGNLETCTPYAQALSGASAPAWPKPPDPTKWQTILGQTVMDGSVQWSFGGPVPQVGIFEVEFEGAGVWILYQALLVATPVAAAAAALSVLGPLGWLLSFLVSLFAAAIAGIGAVAAQSDSSAQTDANNQTGTLHPGFDVVFVMGTWIYDGGHIPGGWNELHPVLFCQKIDTVPTNDLIQGQPWQSLPAYSEANLATTLAGWCDLAGTATDPGTLKLQAQPQNGWTLHPLVDGCVTQMNNPVPPPLR